MVASSSEVNSGADEIGIWDFFFLNCKPYILKFSSWIFFRPVNLSFLKKIPIVSYEPGLVSRETEQMGCAEESVRAREK